MVSLMGKQEDDNLINSKFLSGNAEDVFSFFDSFDTRESLFSWMKTRKKNEPTIYDVDGPTDIVAVIPTSDMNSDRVKTTKESIFKGFRQIYVESVKPYDPYFNYSHNANVGIAEALKLSPEWIVIANDDMVPRQRPERLSGAIREWDHSVTNVLFTNPPGEYHSFQRFIGRPNDLYKLIVTLHPNRSRIHRYKLWKKFGLKYVDALDVGKTGIASKITYRVVKPHLLTGSFTILSSKFVAHQEQVFDETFINGGEDSDLSLRLTKEEEKIGFIDYEIGDMVGTSLGSGWIRNIRNVVNEVYLSYKIEQNLTPI